MLRRLTLLALAACQPADPAPAGCPPAAWAPPPACGTGPRARGSAIPGPGDPGHDADLAARVAAHDHLFAAWFAAPMGVSTEVTVPAEATATRARLARLADGGDEPAAPPPDPGVTWQKSAGAYAGVGIAADAMRYGALRDEGAACAEVDAARTQLLAALDGLHRAWAITGAPGVVARGYAPREAWSVGGATPTTPLFDEAGAPLPAEKDNGTWRDSPTLPGWVWEDSCSRDMLVGWMAGLGAAWEVIARDPTIPAPLKADLSADALALALSLSTVQDSGYDLEIRDADGRMTYHGILHEDSVDRAYLPGAGNGLNASIALGAAAVLAMVTGDASVTAWLDDALVGDRDLPGIVRDRVGLIDAGSASNYSNYNMAFLGGAIAGRYLCDADARAAVDEGMDAGLYDRPGRDRQPAEQGQALYDLVAALARAGAGAWWPAERPWDAEVVDRALTTLRAFPAAPAWDEPRVNCDDDEIAAGVCEAVDGSTITLLSTSGRGDTLVAAHPLPLGLRPPSNYYWRSNPYQVNGGGASTAVYPSVDLRYVYWLGRWATDRPRDPG